MAAKVEEDPCCTPFAALALGSELDVGLGVEEGGDVEGSTTAKMSVQACVKTCHTWDIPAATNEVLVNHFCER